MAFQLEAVTPNGRALVDLADEHAPAFAERAPHHDSDNSYVTGNIDDLKDSGFLAGCVPESFGGMGVESAHDVLVAVSRLARGCASTAIAVNMHLGVVLNNVLRWRDARRAGDADRARELERLLAALGDSVILLCSATTERGALWYAPQTTATPTEGGYVVNGRKSFATNAPAADAFNIAARVPLGDGRYRQALVTALPSDAGVEVVPEWDALGMRGSGSDGLRLADCVVPASRVMLGEEQGLPSAGVLRQHSIVDFTLVGAYLGIAEAARAFLDTGPLAASKAPEGTPNAHRPEVQRQVAEMEVALTTARAVLHRSGEILDAHLLAPDPPAVPMEDVFAEWQSAKLVVQRCARDVVEGAMLVTGGASYGSTHLLARLYRDVKAGVFMQPLAPLDAYPFIGRVRCGLPAFGAL